MTDSLTIFQDGCLIVVAQKACDLSRLALDTRKSGDEFDGEEAASLVMQIIGTIAAAFGEDLTNIQLQQAIWYCGLAPVMCFRPANDDQLHPLGAA